MKQKTKLKEATRVKKTPEHMVQGFCTRLNCVEWSSYQVLDQNANSLGGFCSVDSETVVRALNRVKPILPLSPRDIQLMFSAL